MFLGFDLNDNGCHLACISSADAVPMPVSPVTGGENSLIPVALLKNGNDWLFGDKALEEAAKQQREPVLKLWERALKKELIMCGGKEYEPLKLLAIYVKKVLELTTFVGQWQNADYIIFTVEELYAQQVQLLRELAAELGFDPKRVGMKSRRESFFEYVRHQKKEIYNNDVIVLDYTSGEVVARILSQDSRYRTKKNSMPVCTVTDAPSEGLSIENDERLLSFCEYHLKDRIVSSVYLVGKPVNGELLRETIRFLRMKRQVFAKPLLYAAGACYAARDRVQSKPGEIPVMLYLGDDKLKYNVGLRAYREREEEYLSVVDAGISWYDVNVTKELYLGRERELRFMKIPLVGGNRSEQYHIVRLVDIPPRPEHTTRVRIEAFMDGPKELKVTISDLGFGQIFPSSGVVVKETIRLEE